MAYKAQVMSAAAKQLEKLPRIEQARIVAAIYDLEDDPRPPGSVKLAGTENLWRIRVGEYRVIYESTTIGLSCWSFASGIVETFTGESRQGLDADGCCGHRSAVLRLLQYRGH